VKEAIAQYDFSPKFNKKVLCASISDDVDNTGWRQGANNQWMLTQSIFWWQ
jgi:hypothetical protein